MTNRSRNICGLVLIILGVLGIMGRVFDFRLFSMAKLWPMFVLIPGICFELGYFSSKKLTGLLVPGGILITLGMLFFFETTTGWRFSAYTWPVYILAPAVGLFQLYLFGGRNPYLLIPVGILTGIAAISFGLRTISGFSRFLRGSYIVPIVFVIVGVIVLCEIGRAPV